MYEPTVTKLDERNHTIYMNIENSLVRIICAAKDDTDVFDDIKRILTGVVINRDHPEFCVKLHSGVK